MVFYIIDPENGQKIKHTSFRYLKLVDLNLIKENKFIVDNISLPFKLPDGTILTKFLSEGNCPVYESDSPDKIVKVGFPDVSSLYVENLFRQTLEDQISPIHHHFGYFKLGRNIDQFPYIVMDKMDKTLTINNEKEFLKVFDDVSEILEYLGNHSKDMEDAGYAYNDFKPSNIMYNNKLKKWMLIDLETFTTIGLNPIPKHSSAYAPTKFLQEMIKIGQREEVYTTQFTDLESIIYTLYEAYNKKLPWNEHKKTKNKYKIIEMREEFLNNPKSKIDRLLKALYVLSLNKQKENSLERLNASSLKKMARDFLA
jgi:serine/threonine protein kinase